MRNGLTDRSPIGSMRTADDVKLDRIDRGLYVRCRTQHGRQPFRLPRGACYDAWAKVRIALVLPGHPPSLK